jgi:hypothetical protein
MQVQGLLKGRHEHKKQSTVAADQPILTAIHCSMPLCYANISQHHRSNIHPQLVSKLHRNIQVACLRQFMFREMASYADLCCPSVTFHNMQGC